MLSTVTLTAGTLDIDLAANEQNLTIFANETADTLIIAVDGTTTATIPLAEITTINITANDLANLVDLSGIPLGTTITTTVDLRAGDDTLIGSMAPDQVNGGSGDDLIFGGGQPDTVTGGEGNDTLSGNSGGDLIDGSSGEDLILGQGGSDTLTGGADFDVLAGGSGTDEFQGEAPLEVADVAIVVLDVTVNESAGTIVPQVVLTDILSSTVTLQYSPADVTALRNLDYSLTGSEFSLTPTQLTAGIPVHIIDDQTAEAAEVFSIVITGTVNGVLIHEHADVVIEDNDSSIQMTGVDNGDGVILLANTWDYDLDNVPGYADGFDMSGGISEDDQSEIDFSPLTIVVKAFDLSQATISFDYPTTPFEAILPDDVTPFPAPYENTIRIWAKNGSEPRSQIDFAIGGDFIVPLTSYRADRIVASSLYLEGLARSFEMGGVVVSATLDAYGDGTHLITFALPVTVVEVDLHTSAGDLHLVSDTMTFSFEVFDPRDSLTHMTINGTAVPLIGGAGRYVTNSMTLQDLGDAEANALNWQYNPDGVAGVIKEPKIPQYQKNLLTEIDNVVAEMKLSETWMNAYQTSDDGAFGKEVHTRGA